jgi:hypothetical protein
MRHPLFSASSSLASLHFSTSVTGFGGNGCSEVGEDEVIGLISSPHEPLPPLFGMKAIDLDYWLQNLQELPANSA